MFLSLYVLGLARTSRWHIVGDAQRLIPELDLAMLLAGAALVSAFWHRRRLRDRALAIPLKSVIPAGIVLIASAYPAIRYVRHAYFPFPKADPVENQYEFLVSKWGSGSFAGGAVYFLPAR